MTLWARIHGLLLGLPLVVLVFLCVSSMNGIGETWQNHWRSSDGKRWMWFGLLFFAWATPLSGMWVMYSRPRAWRAGGEWISWGLPWMASWGMMVPILATACVYMNRRLRDKGQGQSTGPWLVLARRSVMVTTLGIVLLVALLGALSARGVTYP